MNSRETILIVDDQEENLRVVCSMLAMMNYDIIPANSSEQALKRLASRSPDLVLLDVLMPDTDGLTTCRQIKADPRWADLPIIFLSAADDKNLIVQALEAGGVDYVTKPFNKAELVSRVRTQLSLKRARDELRTLAEDKDEILGILTHDLQNHLAGIQISGGLLKNRAAELPPRCASLVENIFTAADNMLVFVREFLANQSAERLQVRSHPLDVCEIGRAAVKSQQAAATAKNITLESTIPDQPILVQADDEALRQTLENILSNAVKFTPPAGHVTLLVEPPAMGVVRCTIRDSGPGFTADDRQKMFRRYGRLSARPTGNEPSTGLGLSIVKRLVDAMGGSISLSENGGAGAEFVITLLPASETPSSN